MVSNLDSLTNSHRAIAAKKRAKREQIKEVVFDDEARRDFLTGFHKRKVQKKEAAKKKAQDREKQERLEARREKRQLLAERAAQNAADTERAYGGGVDNDNDDEEWPAAPGSVRSKGKGKERELEEEYEDNVQLATVTVVEDFDPEALVHGLDHLPEDVRLQPGDVVSPLSNPPASTSRGKPESISRSHGSALKKNDSKSGTSAPGRAKAVAKTKIKYQTNAARKIDRLKQRRRKTEKAERAGGKQSRKRKVPTKGKR